MPSADGVSVNVKEPFAAVVTSRRAVPLRVTCTTWPAGSAAVEVRVPLTVRDRPGTAVAGAVSWSEVAALGFWTRGASLTTGPLIVCTSGVSPVPPEKARSALGGSVTVWSSTCVPSIRTYT